MLAILYLLGMIYFGDCICRYFFRFKTFQHRLATSFLVGLLLSSCITYLGSLAFASAAQPLIWGNLIFLGVLILAAYLMPRRPSSDYLNSVSLRPIGDGKWDWLCLGICFIFGCWLIFATLSFQDGNFQFGFKSWSDYGANLSLSQSFVLGHNFPTEHPFYAGEMARYHFLFWFQAANLSFLGLNLVFSINLLSLLSLMALLVLIMTFAELLFDSRVVGRIAAILFFFASSSLSYIPFLWSKPDIGTALSSIVNSTQFLDSGYLFRGENWGALSVSVFIYQRHLISSVGILFIVMIFLADFYRHKKSLVKPEPVPVLTDEIPPQIDEMVMKADEIATEEDKFVGEDEEILAKESEIVREEVGEEEVSENVSEIVPENEEITAEDAEILSEAAEVTRETDQSNFEPGEISDEEDFIEPENEKEFEAVSVNENEIVIEEEKNIDGENDEILIENDALSTDEVVEDDEISIDDNDDETVLEDVQAATSENIVQTEVKKHRNLLTIPENFWIDVQPFLFCGLLLGAMPYWNSAIFVSSMIVLSSIFLVFPYRFYLGSLIGMAIVIGLPQVLMLKSGNVPESGPSLFTPGYVIANPTLWLTIKYLLWTFGFKWLLISIALWFLTKSHRRLFLAISVLLPVVFLLQLSPDAFNNHKLLNVWNMFALIYVAYALWRIGKGSFSQTLLAAILALAMVFGAIIDIFPLRNDSVLVAPYKDDRLTNWLFENTKTSDVFLTAPLLTHPILFSGRKIFFGNTLFAWTAGYNVGQRESEYKKIFTEKNPGELLRLLHENNISYIAIDDGVRTNGLVKDDLNEAVIQQNFEKVFEDTEHRNANVTIYKVPEK